jgi:hypothetical protein
MKTSALIRWFALGVSAAALAGCYTVLNAPLSGPELQGPSLRAEENDAADAAPGLGRADEPDRWDDSYGYSRYGGGYGGGYGPGYGGPVFGWGYDSTYGYNPYFGYGYGYPYGYGHGPYSYGYDPYYLQGSGATYVPAGYTLVSDGELAQLRSYSQTVAAAKEKDSQADAQAAAAEKAAQETRVRKQQETWERRADPQDRAAPATTPKPAAQPAPAPSPPAKPAATASEPADKGSAQPKKTRR